jgi:competence protein ComGC
MRRNDFDLRNKKKRKFRLLEKLAIFIIVLLVLLILILVFNKQITEFYESFKAWYGSA